MICATKMPDGSIANFSIREPPGPDDVVVARMPMPFEVPVTTCAPGCPSGPHSPDNPYCVVPKA